MTVCARAVALPQHSGEITKQSTLENVFRVAAIGAVYCDNLQFYCYIFVLLERLHLFAHWYTYYGIRNINQIVYSL